MNHEPNNVWAKTHWNLAENYQNKNCTVLACQIQLLVKTHCTYGKNNNWYKVYSVSFSVGWPLQGIQTHNIMGHDLLIIKQ